MDRGIVSSVKGERKGSTKGEGSIRRALNEIRSHRIILRLSRWRLNVTRASRR